jgi:diguanylate cyclase (GGDEF)-like protein
MPDNVFILIAFLVAANIVLIAVAIIRAFRRQRREAKFQEPTTNADLAPLPTVSRGFATSAPIPVMDANQPPSRSDPLTGMLLPGEWNRILADEDARINRYGRPATIVIVELDGLDRLIGALGQEAGDRVLPAVADALSRGARGADHIARLGPGRFGVLLPETGEVEAVNYVERVRQVCDLWLESGAIALRLAIGWASPAIDSTLADAFVEAQDRMYAELRRSARRAPGAASDGPPPPPPAAGLEGAPSPA